MTPVANSAIEAGSGAGFNSSFTSVKLSVSGFVAVGPLLVRTSVNEKLPLVRANETFVEGVVRFEVTEVGLAPAAPLLKLSSRDVTWPLLLDLLSVPSSIFVTDEIPCVPAIVATFTVKLRDWYAPTVLLLNMAEVVGFSAISISVPPRPFEMPSSSREPHETQFVKLNVVSPYWYVVVDGVAPVL
jgi:hypothetical protein